jgi:hypothetical protein
MLIYAEGERRGNDALHKIKGCVKDEKAFKGGAYRGEKRLICRKNDLFGREDDEIKGVRDKIVDGNCDKRHKDRT